MSLPQLHIDFKHPDEELQTSRDEIVANGLTPAQVGMYFILRKFPLFTAKSIATAFGWDEDECTMLLAELEDALQPWGIRR